MNLAGQRVPPVLVAPQRLDRRDALSYNQVHGENRGTWNTWNTTKLLIHEFRTIFELYLNYEALTGAAPPAGEVPPEQRPNALAKLAQDIAAALGPARFKEYQMRRSADYQVLQRFLAKQGIDTAIAVQIYDLQQGIGRLLTGLFERADLDQQKVSVAVNQLESGFQLAPSRRLSSAFTIVELLTVVSIIGLLATLLLPALNHAKSSARSAKCQNNLRQLGIGLHLYVADHRYYPGLPLPYVLSRKDYSPDTPTIPKRVSFPDVFLCTEGRGQISFQIVDETGNDVLNTNIVMTPPFGYNMAGTDHIKDPTKLPTLGLGVMCLAERVRAPSDMIALGCKQYQGGRSISPYMDAVGKVSARHRGRANILFCDGHLEAASQAKWIVPTERARRRWNNDNEPHAETWR